ncbi:hypothetical protein EZ456_00865 [Pedobacter psychrodurus]|uniref:MoxR-vWA-beta-propeller ternary system domain-containing protein n=1 Tax=Pedobacter psychrodurus TaxID=2530456 RepID=A0A4R0Q191_9SPHI|nr:hypothetical protein [Pedobacter psychrodurus]TCD29599.1 hypothetical protein EZ456_00865 [Pedobacter psychrodurus]
MLDLFLIDLIQTGQVTVPNQIVDFDAATSDQAIVLLEAYYQADALTMPHNAPNFDPEAALWAAKYIFSTLQLVLLRDIGEEKLNQLLTDYKGAYTSEAVYSADLMLRFLPDIFRFASGLSPEDPLIYKLKTTARLWPFSSIGIAGINVTVGDKILDHPSLRVAYIDRIMLKKDINRINGEHELKLMKEALGAYQTKLWPGLNLVLNKETI